MNEIFQKLNKSFPKNNKESIPISIDETITTPLIGNFLTRSNINLLEKRSSKCVFM